MTVGSKYAIATFSDWLKNFAPVFQPMRSKPKIITPCWRDFFRALSKLREIASNSDRFIAFSAPVVIGRSNYFGFLTVILKPL